MVDHAPWVVCFAFAVASCAQSPPTLCEEMLHDQRVVIAAWRHQPVGGEPPATYGLDLDHRVSDGTGPSCFDEEDFVSTRRGASGVDNQYAGSLLPLLQRAVELADGPGPAVLDQFSRGEQLLGLDIAVGADRIPRVDLVALEALDTVTFDSDPSGLASDQRFRVLRRERVSARCTAGMLELAWETFDLPFGETVGSVPLHDVHALVGVDATGAVSEGELGARYPVSLVVEVAAALGIAGIDEPAARAIAGPDLDPSSDGLVCSSISIGVGFDLAPATLE